MSGQFHHEQLYRTPEQMAKFAASRLIICGAGAVGSNLAENLARQGLAHLCVIDRDKVEEHNISTQLYGQSDIGIWKVESLRNRLFRATGVEIEPVRKELTLKNSHQLLMNADLVIDAFDNSDSRRAVQDQCRKVSVSCLHVGLYEGYCEVIWDEHYRVPSNVGGDVCDYPLARNLILLAVAIASETVVASLTEGVRKNWSATLRDLSIRPLEVPDPG